ncbi:hypothetical protein THAOC_32603 [Thalassiosira oceanica]|uniref:Uncharacterized protein n=1 Tax=Thalassiosira oceanica TaxID=159749 RepID=K0R6U1_THAOC|nr:hypothetical protein THAOC_32603 [Thalassiosira oceanica]|eukprot:EJK48585.1 hypothetical protein THAOC_32603 [Thalassiosira oceanica]
MTEKIENDDVHVAGALPDELPSLPEEIYYRYVRPFTPHRDRPALNKRTGSSRYYHGKRVDIDLDYLRKFGERGRYHGGRIERAEDDMPAVFDLPFVEGTPGTSTFRILFPEREGPALDGHRTTDPDVAVQILNTIRASWDEHISKIESPSARLQISLYQLFLFYEDMLDNSVGFAPPDCMLLFPKDSLQQLIWTHYDLNPASANGPPVTDPDFAPCPLPGVGLHKTVPNSVFGNVIGVLVALAVTHELADLDEDQKKIFNGKSQVALCMAVTIARVADVSPLFESLDELPQEALNRGPALYSLDCVSIISSLLFVDEMWEPGQCLLDCLKHFLSTYSCKGYNLSLLEWLVSRIEERGPVQKLRFAVGVEVECFMGYEQGWQRGKVNALWAHQHPDHSYGQMKSPYEVLLDGTGGESERMIYAP